MSTIYETLRDENNQVIRLGKGTLYSVYHGRGKFTLSENEVERSDTGHGCISTAYEIGISLLSGKSILLRAGRNTKGNRAKAVAKALELINAKVTQ